MDRYTKVLFVLLFIAVSLLVYLKTGHGDHTNAGLFEAAVFALEEIQGQSLSPLPSSLVPQMSFIAEPIESGHGIVACAGNFRALELLSGLLWVRELERVQGLRALPVEWYYVGDMEMDADLREYVKKRLGNIRFIDCAEHYHDPKLLRGFQIKSFALSRTKFHHAVFLDSDCIPVEHPTKIFSSNSYKEKGNMFWPDFAQNWGAMSRRVLHKSKTFRKVLDSLPGKNERDLQVLLDIPEAESGQLFIDTVRFRDVLQVAWLLNEKSKIFYKFTYGDKNLFMIAFYLTGNIDSYNQVSAQPFTFRNINGRHEAIGQTNPFDSSKAMFVHRTHQKHNCLSRTSTCILDVENGYREMRHGYPVPGEETFPVAEDVLSALRFVAVQEKELLGLPVFAKTLSYQKKR